MLGWAILAAIVLRIVIPRWRKQPPNRAAAIAVSVRGIQPTGPGGVWTRGDRLRAAGLSGTIALGLAALTWLGAFVSGRTSNGSAVNLIATGALFVGVLGLLLAVLVALGHLARAPFAQHGSSAPAPKEES